MNFFYKTNVGKVRNDNQDYCYAQALSDNSILAVVCDGMGGVSGGRIASEIAVRSVFESVKKYYLPTMSQNEKVSVVNKAIDVANAVVFEISKQETDLSGMGTTLVLALIEGRKAHIFHIGDSRAYLASNNNIRQITRDHSFVQEMLDLGQLSVESAKNHPKKNIITRALGVSDNVESDYTSINIKENDRLLICTDGLTNEVSNEFIAQIVSENSGDVACDKLIEMALDNGGADNITVCIVL